MQHFIAVLVILFHFTCFLFPKNKDPIILLHGFLGWGRDELSGYYYWGGKTDLELELRESGFDVYTVSVGPISPNWDRAIETFYQIKGGQVDYGNEKTGKYGIIQRPPEKNYRGHYSIWDENHPVHIIAHSQGGQTARMLEVLLKKSLINENSPLLSNEYRGWIKSITTISTPHNGTTLSPILLDLFPFALNLAPWIGIIDNDQFEKFYNFDLEHWRLKKHPDEKIKEYFNRLKQSPITKSKNLCSWDLSLEGSADFNQEYTADTEVYYFSYSSYATKPKKVNHKHVPDSAMSIHLWPTGLLIGQYGDAPNSAWYENDGISNTISMTHPVGSNMKPYDGYLEKGVWQFIDKLHMDHQSVIGHHVNENEMNKLIALYKNHCSLLYSLK